MLSLEHKDLGPNPVGSPGVNVWWVQRPGRKTKDLVVAWPDLILIKPTLSWPEHMHPERRGKWRQETLRFAWVKEMASMSVLAGVPVPDLKPLLELKRGQLERLRATKHTISLTTRKKLSCLECVDGSGVYLGRRTLRRMVAAIEQPARELDLRLAPSSAMALVYRNGLRGVASVISEQEALGHGRD